MNPITSHSGTTGPGNGAAAPTRSAASFHNVTQVFGDFTAVDGISLEIPAGRLTTLLGPSGCGKTTSLRMLAGYTQPSSGTIYIDGEDATRLPPERRGLGMVFQSYALFPHMTVAENVAYGLKLRRLPRAEQTRRAAESLDLVGLGHLARSRPRQLSGGQQQRVALARAIAVRPKLLLLDEPLSNLDARLRVQMRAEIRRIQSETGLSVVLVTHDQDEALEMSDEMVVMRAGRIMQQGAPASVFGAPANRFVAEFMGYENFLSAPDGTTLTVRPEHLHVLPSSAAEGHHADLRLSGEVLDLAYRGVDVLVTVAAREADGRDVRLICDVRAGAAADLHRGDPVDVVAPASHVIALRP
ncbi:ABC transporter ATP-binding protein [Nesterenkonia sandarakina]|uniref:ABC-type quaternary amine transporter n=1 Tax=Nesterenkonia sandarakina TaxID=272918 RepID=A0A7Z0J343_9MICC|nr:ABC transporter ATP-binding protein [Nesterenkonia sandarakina]NYJ16925.1 putative spermidine/putrescine transport system ATP-binding protein [Nesterenkonia sandarakina]